MREGDFFFFSRLGINKLLLLLASCNADTCTDVLSTYNFLHAICLCVSLCVRILLANFAHRLLKLDKTPNGALERGKSGWSSSQAGCFAYHYGYVILINHHGYGELGSLCKINNLSGDDDRKLKHSRTLRPWGGSS